MHLNLLLENLVTGNIEKFAKEIEGFLKSAASIHDYATQPEAFYHGFMLALTASLMDNYYIDSNKETGDGRPDMLFIPKDAHKSQAVILEFKHANKKEAPKTVAKKALKQIDVKAYAAKLSQHSYIKTVLKVGLAFDGKQVHYQVHEVVCGQTV